MKKLLFLLVAIVSIGAMSCKTAKNTQKQQSDLEALLAELRNSISDIDVSYLDGNVKIILAEAVYFKTGSAELSNSAADKLDKIATVINKYPKTKLDLNGYTDNVGTPANNLVLSKERAVNVKNYMESRSVKARRMKAIGNGEGSPVASNATNDGRMKNRRVEFLIHY